MSDFFGDVASRSFGSTPAIRPRLAALFEPLSGSGTRFPGFSPEPDPGEPLSFEDRQDESSHRPSVQPLAFPAPARGRTSRQPEEASLESASAGSPEEVGTGDSVSSGRQDPRAVRPGPPESQPQGGAGWKVNAPNSAESTVRGFNTPESPPEPSDANGEAWSRRVTAAVQIQPRRSGRRGERLDPAVESSPPVRSHASDRAPWGHLLPPIVNSLLPRSSEPTVSRSAKLEANSKALARALLGLRQREDGAGETRTDPEPAIQVTIGRIEVRATAPSTPSGRAERRPTAVMGLDEYLRQRARRSGE